MAGLGAAESETPPLPTLSETQTSVALKYLISLLVTLFPGKKVYLALLQIMIFLKP